MIYTRKERIVYTILNPKLWILIGGAYAVCRFAVWA